MKKSRFTEAQITFALRQAEAGIKAAEIRRRMKASEPTFSRLKKQFGDLGTAEMRELRQLRKENGTLKKLVADLSIDRTAVHLRFAGFGSRMTFDTGFFGGPRLCRSAAPALDAILTTANHDDHDHRPSSAQAFAESLEDWLVKAA